MQHQGLAAGRWQLFSLSEQLANVGAEVGRAISWRSRNAEHSQVAFERALELLDITIEDPKNSTRLKELLRVREALVDYFVGENEFKSSDESWERYFGEFNYQANLRRGMWG